LPRASRPIAAIAVALALALPSAARANGDPASDVLLEDDVFFAFQPKPSPTAATAVKVLLRRTRAAGYPLHVAIIASGGDLGDVPEYFGRPQDYADYLYPEIDFQVKGPLLVVMPAGYGSHSAGKKAEQALADVGAPSGRDRDALPRAAIAAAAAMAKAEGHPVKAPKLAGPGSSGSSALVPVLVLVGMLVLGGALAVWKRSTVVNSSERE
jgi:hypothetical protein